MWECEWNEIKLQIEPNEVEYYEEVSENIITDREMFYGGRTEVFCPHVEADEDHSLDYIHVCSLYSTVCARDELPTGHLTRYFDYEAERQNIVYVKIIQIVSLAMFDVISFQIQTILLPSHTDGKLLFDVRPKTGVWLTEEIYLAMRHGYTIETIYEIFHFDANIRSNTFVKGYMSYIFRQKQQAEGWKKARCSSENLTEEEKDAAICRLQAENPDKLPMRKEMVLRNDVKLQVAKIYLNCLWGKFGQSPDQTLTKSVYGFEEFQKLLLGF
jgi:DNA polymerase type B, organellar and viral